MLSSLGFKYLKVGAWGQGFEVVKVKSSVDGSQQLVYARNCGGVAPLIVSLHSWSGDYRENDGFRNKVKGFHYIHPDFRGANYAATPLALSDIDDAIDYALENFRVSDIYVVGGYAALAMYMRSKHKVNTYSVWSAVSDLGQWYSETAKYRDSIYAATDGLKFAADFSPLFWESASDSKLNMYAGIHQGKEGLARFIHSTNFYNKIICDRNCNISSCYVNNEEIFNLSQGKFNTNISIGNRPVMLFKEYGNISLTLFRGDHEMLVDYMIDTLD